MLVKIKDINANPFRDITRYPINREKVEALRKSIQKTGFWDNVVARQIGGDIQLAYGHHRLVALKEEYSGEHEVDLIVRDLADEDMIRIMANENMDEWANNAAVTMETIRAVVAAYADRKIQLPKVSNKIHEGRNAPSFQVINSDQADPSYIYTSKTIADFLGWHHVTVKRTLQLLEAVENSLASDDDFSGISLGGASGVCAAAKHALKDYDDPKLAKRIIKDMTARIRSGIVSLDSVRDESRKIIADEKGVTLPGIDRFASRIATEIHNFLAPEKQLRNKLTDLLGNVSDIPEQNVDDLVDSFDRLSRDASEWADKFRRYQTVVAMREIS